jgi:tRNA G10  N-methylase Trm11
MLIERQMQVKANTSYGIDIMEDAIEGAKINTEAAGQIIHYINKNFFDFTHEYLFDEIFTNMPFAIGRKTQEEINLLYHEFFEKAKTHLVSDGRIIMYTHDQDLVETLVPEYGYNFLANYEINKKEGTHLYILEK